MAEPIDPMDANDPMLPIESAEPTLPIDRIECEDPIDRIELCDFHESTSETSCTTDEFTVCRSVA